MSIAVIKTGGKQYVVSEGKVLKIEKIEGEKGETVTFNEVFLVADEKATSVEVGTPTVAGTTVEAQIMVQGRNRKIDVVHYKAKIRYYKVYGHRQQYTQIKITKIGKASATKKETVKKVETEKVVKKTKPVAKKTTKK